MDKPIRVVSPTGVGQYTWLTEADTRFDSDGHFKTNLIITTDEAQPLVNEIKRALKQAQQIASERMKKGQKVKWAPEPFFAEVDDAGNPTGNTIFKFKTKAQIVSKDGKVIENRVPIFDSKGQPLKDTQVWSGSELKCSADLIPYYTAVVGAGVSLRLRAVQVIKLVEGSGGSAQGFGFAEVKDGYEAPATDESFTEELETDAEEEANIADF